MKNNSIFTSALRILDSTKHSNKLPKCTFPYLWDGTNNGTHIVSLVFMFFIERCNCLECSAFTNLYSQTQLQNYYFIIFYIIIFFKKYP